DHVGADDEVLIGVERQARANHSVPPAGLARDRMRVEDMLVAGQRVADEDGIGAVRIELAIGLVGNLQRREIDAAIELERLVHAELYDLGRGMIGLVQAIVDLDRRAYHRLQLGHLSTGLRMRRSLNRHQANKKPGLNEVRPGCLSPACLAIYLTWLQAGRLK